MYVFVFMWTPLLSESVKEFHDSSLGLHGLTFAAFMVSVMIGSSVYSLVRTFYSVEAIYMAMLGVAASTFLVVSRSSV